MTDMTVFEQILKIILKLTCGLRKQPTPNALFMALLSVKVNVNKYSFIHPLKYKRTYLREHSGRFCCIK